MLNIPLNIPQRHKDEDTQIGVTLSDEDLEAIKELFSNVWNVDVTLRNWKEKGTGNYCQWQLRLPDKSNNYFTVTNNNLVEAVDVALKVHWQGKEYPENGVDKSGDMVYND